MALHGPADRRLSRRARRRERRVVIWSPLIERTGESTEQHQQQRERQEAATEVIVWECTEAAAGGQDGTARSVAALGEQLNVAPINGVSVYVRLCYLYF